ncbi:MAG: HYD1 signature containing ADP-ribosyltransferase family protein [Planctomycetota bacterium]
MILYHYTNWSGYNGILFRGQVNSSTNTLLDAAGGPGAYFTDFAPSSCQVQLMNSCFGPRINKSIGYYICMDIPAHLLRSCRDHVFLVPETIRASFPIIGHGQKHGCPQGACATCTNNTPEIKESATSLEEIFEAALKITAGVAVLFAFIGLLGWLFNKK